MAVVHVVCQLVEISQCQVGYDILHQLANLTKYPEIRIFRQFCPWSLESGIGFEFLQHWMLHIDAAH